MIMAIKCIENDPPNFEEGVMWLIQAGNQEMVEAQFFLGCFYEDDRGGQQDISEAARWFLRAAQHGHLQALHKLLNCLHHAECALVIPSRKIARLKRAADKEEPEAMLTYGLLQIFGIGKKIKPAPAQGLELVKQAAYCNHADAQCFLGNCYHVGLGVEPDRQKAMHWWYLAAKNGNESATENMKS